MLNSYLVFELERNGVLCEEVAHRSLSEDSDSPIGLIEEATGGLGSGEESELDRLLENESDISR